MKLHPEGEWAMGPNPEGGARGMRGHCPFTQGMQFHCTPRAHVAEILSHGLLYNEILGLKFIHKSASFMKFCGNFSKISSN